MAVLQNLESNTVLLDSYVLPIAGPVRSQSVDILPGKITIGPSKRSDQVLADEWTMEDWTGGMLVNEIDETVHSNRFTWSTADTRRRDQITLNPYVYQIAKPTGVTADCDFTIDFDTTKLKYASFGGDVYKWDGTGLTASSWSTRRVNMTNPVIAGIVFTMSGSTTPVLVLANGTKFSTSTNGTAWTDHTASATIPNPVAFALFDVDPTLKLMCIDANGKIWATTDVTDDTKWVNSVTVVIKDRTITGLQVFRNADDKPTLFVMTSTGPYSVDVWNNVAYQTSLELPSSVDAGKGHAVWNDGNMYVSDDLALWRYPRLGQIINTGLDREDGVPTFLRGRILEIEPTPNYIIAVVDASEFVNAGNDTFNIGTNEFTGVNFPDTDLTGYSALMAYNGNGWHNLFGQNSINKSIKAIDFSTIYSEEHRLFFSDDGFLSYLVMPEGNYNPLMDINARFVETGYVVTGNFDGGYSETIKTISSIKLKCKNISATNTITVSYWINGANWETTGATGLGVISTANSDWNATTNTIRFLFGSKAGIAVNSIRFKFEFNRATGVTNNDDTPALLFFAMRYKKRLSTLIGWTFQVKGTDNEYLQNMWLSIYDLKKTNTLVQFGYKAHESEERYVIVNNISGVEYTATDNTSFYTVNCVELEPPDD